MRTMNYDEAMKFAKEKGDKCAIYELDTKRHQFEYIGNGSDDDVNEILMNLVYLYEGDVVCNSLPYSMVNRLIEVQSDNGDSSDLDQLFEVPEESMLECPVCYEKFNSIGELTRHQYETGHESVSPGEIKSNFCYEACYCIAGLKKIMKKAANRNCDDSAECKKLIDGINNSIMQLEEIVSKCEHKS